MSCMLRPCRPGSCIGRQHKPDSPGLQCQCWIQCHQRLWLGSCRRGRAYILLFQQLNYSTLQGSRCTLRRRKTAQRRTGSKKFAQPDLTYHIRMGMRGSPRHQLWNTIRLGNFGKWYHGIVRRRSLGMRPDTLPGQSAQATHVPQAAPALRTTSP